MAEEKNCRGKTPAGGGGKGGKGGYGGPNVPSGHDGEDGEPGPGGKGGAGGRPAYSTPYQTKNTYEWNENLNYLPWYTRWFGIGGPDKKHDYDNIITVGGKGGKGGVGGLNVPGGHDGEDGEPGPGGKGGAGGRPAYSTPYQSKNTYEWNENLNYLPWYTRWFGIGGTGMKNEYENTNTGGGKGGKGGVGGPNVPNGRNGEDGEAGPGGKGGAGGRQAIPSDNTSTRTSATDGEKCNKEKDTSTQNSRGSNGGKPTL